jgi:hypothetical protein
MLLNLSVKEAVQLRLVLKERRQKLFSERDYRRWLEWPEGRIYKKLCKLLGKKQ